MASVSQQSLKTLSYVSVIILANWVHSHEVSYHKLSCSNNSIMIFCSLWSFSIVPSSWYPSNTGPDVRRYRNDVYNNEISSVSVYVEIWVVSYTYVVQTGFISKIDGFVIVSICERVCSDKFFLYVFFMM